MSKRARNGGADGTLLAAPCTALQEEAAAPTARALMPSGLTRRDFLGQGALALGVVACAGGAGAWTAFRGEGTPAAVSASTALGEILSFHLDQPYVDVTGTAQPYVPPRGARAAQGLAELTDEQLYALYFCV